ncbi:MAG: hypothetical protein M1281_20585 [Chloroflexi bacterium]|nr:hypothetical protein [Chloroflexota bacterium]
MSTKTALAQSSLFKIGWLILVVLAALMALNHFALIFFLDEPVLFTGFAVFNLYALVVILLPFRQGEKWAWLITWLLPIGLALPAATDPNIATFYFGVAAFCMLGLLLTMQMFFGNGMGK